MAEVRGMSLFKKTGLLAFCLFGIISLSASGLTAWTLYDRMTEEYVSKGSAIAASIASGSQEILLVRDAATVQSMIDQYLDIEGVAYVFVVDGEKKVVSHTFVPEMPKALKDIYRPKAGHIQELDIQELGHVIDICKPVLAGVAGYVHVGMDKEVIIAYFWEVILGMQALLFAIFWICVGILYVVTLRISRPLDSLTEYARKLAAHDFSATVDIRTKDELEVLGRAMHSMGQELSLLFSEMEHEVEKATGDLRDNMAYLSAIIDNLADGLLVVGVSGEITVINPAMREYFDLGDGDYRGFHSKGIFPSEVMQMTSEIRECSGEVVTAEIPLTKGRTGKAVGTSIQVETPSNQCLGGVILIRDITREKELDQLKTDFISTVSHELRTPMTSVLGFSKIIRKKLDSAVFPALSGEASLEKPVNQVRSNMEIIVTEAERLTDLINDVLDIARMEAGKVRWRDSQLSMADVVEQSRSSTMGLWTDKGLEVELDIADDLPPVYGDYDRLVQVVVNLISNAVKFTEVSPIVCRVRQAEGAVHVSVEDKGQGIRRDDLGHVFDKFKQVGDTLTEKPSGTGLGLPISRQIVERHAGRIWAESEPGKGSTFHFLIPTAGSDVVGGDEIIKCVENGDALLPDELTRDETPLILVVDDDPSLVSYLTQVFTDQGFRVEVAYNGKDGVAKAEALRPDVITMDVMMPGMNGHAAIGCLRKNLVTRNTPVLVITALGGEEGEGGDMSLVKPVDEDRLIAAVWSLLNRKAANTPCVMVGDADIQHVEDMTLMCSNDMVFVSADELWDQVENGYSGVVFVSAEDTETVRLEQLIKKPNISVVILPVCDCK